MVNFLISRKEKILSMLAILLLSCSTTIQAKTVLITGSNRGIGIEFVRQYAQLGWNVIATSRTPDDDKDLLQLQNAYSNIVLKPLDVTNHPQIDKLAAELKDKKIDVLLNNAGILGGSSEFQSIGNVDFDAMELVYKTNAIGPLKMAESFLPHIAASTEKKIIVITSGTASIANVKKSKYFKPLYLYRMSKTAINIGFRALSVELKDQGILIGIMAPGIVETRLLQQAGYAGMGMTTKKSVSSVIKNISELNTITSGTYRLYNGDTVPW